MPSLVGKRVPEAGALAARHGLCCCGWRAGGTTRGCPRTASWPRSRTGGSTLKRQRSIRVWVSLGPRRLDVPGGGGREPPYGPLEPGAGAGAVGRVVEVDDRRRRGRSSCSTRRAGETDAVGRRAWRCWSAAAPAARDYLMPDLIGRHAADVHRRPPRGPASRSPEVRYRTYPGVAPGIVLRQIPAAGLPREPAHAGEPRRQQGRRP